MILTSQARAYVNFGRWIADCPMGCGNATGLNPGQATFLCATPGGCGHVGSIEWPSNADEIWEVLLERPAPRTRNWFPSSHELALRAGQPHGQTIEELREEARENGVI